MPSLRAAASWLVGGSLAAVTRVTTAEASPWQVRSGECSVQGSCVRSPNYPHTYATGQSCEIKADRGTIISVEAFGTDVNHDDKDYLLVNGRKYFGRGANYGPGGVQPVGTILWSSDSTSQGFGWSLCAQAEYSLRSAGTCSEPIATPAECSLAAQSIGLSERNATVGLYRDFPKGCFLWDSSRLYFSTGGTVARCTQTSQCMCKAERVSSAAELEVAQRKATDAEAKVDKLQQRLRVLQEQATAVAQPRWTDEFHALAREIASGQEATTRNVTRDMLSSQRNIARALRTNLPNNLPNNPRAMLHLFRHWYYCLVGALLLLVVVALRALRNCRKSPDFPSTVVQPLLEQSQEILETVQKRADWQERVVVQATELDNLRTELEAARHCLKEMDAQARVNAERIVSLEGERDQARQWPEVHIADSEDGNEKRVRVMCPGVGAHSIGVQRLPNGARVRIKGGTLKGEDFIQDFNFNYQSEGILEFHEDDCTYSDGVLQMVLKRAPDHWTQLGEGAVVSQLQKGLISPERTMPLE